ncbi:pentapeptide repeat-containing protein [Acidiphilium rubrum]|uniref:Fluoroquinolone resistance protein n=2 Tax=Acidiphilium TaxID=522 RepID=A0A8G2CN11_ACIRU|nr:pentapeptide repeat-containing protein [Acidiphilium rubrum]SIR35337.1 fluoroquinolone resistance protein [Acidiphilium rubrum]
MTLADVMAAINDRGAISGETLRSIDWGDAVCEDAHFIDCQFADTAFGAADFTGARFERCQFARCGFARTVLRDAGFEECRFTVPGDPPVGSRFAFADLRNARFRRCDLSFAVFERSDLHAIEMHGCNLRGARLHQVDFGRAIGRKNVVTRAVFNDCNFDFAELADACLPGCDLARCRFREADLGGVDFTDADLSGGDFTEAITTGMALAGADVRGGDLGALNLLALASFARLKITQSQGDGLLQALRIDLHPDPAG